MLLEGVMNKPAHKVALTPEVYRDFHARYRQTKVFVFDESASRAMGEFAIGCADLVVKNEEFAIPPFDNCYIELDNWASLPAPVKESAERIGYWFIDGAIYCLAGNEKEPLVVPLVYRRIDEKMPKDVPPEYTQTKEYLLLGQVGEGIDREKLAKRLASRWHFALTVKIPEVQYREVVAECVGGLKRALASVLLLNQRQTYTILGKSPTRKIVKGKQRVYLAHNVVTIDLGPKVLRKAFYTGLRDTPRAHEVRGEFVHRYRVPGCTHEWEKVVDPEREQADLDRVGYVVPRWECKYCTGLRSWRRPHHRGDASKGFVTKAYEVTKTA